MTVIARHPSLREVKTLFSSLLALSISLALCDEWRWSSGCSNFSGNFNAASNSFSNNRSVMWHRRLFLVASFFLLDPANFFYNRPVLLTFQRSRQRVSRIPFVYREFSKYYSFFSFVSFFFFILLRFNLRVTQWLVYIKIIRTFDLFFYRVFNTRGTFIKLVYSFIDYWK